MFIECSNCQFKYLVNSAELKPNGRMVECANCNHQWFQELDDIKTSSSVFLSKKENTENIEKQVSKKHDNSNQIIKNLPSTVVRDKKPSIINSSLLVILIVIIFFGIWILRSFGFNTLVLIDFYINEFIFNLNLIISDLAKIFYNILN